MTFSTRINKHSIQIMGSTFNQLQYFLLTDIYNSLCIYTIQAIIYFFTNQEYVFPVLFFAFVFLSSKKSYRNQSFYQSKINYNNKYYNITVPRHVISEMNRPISGQFCSVFGKTDVISCLKCSISYMKFIKTCIRCGNSYKSCRKTCKFCSKTCIIYFKACMNYGISYMKRDSSCTKFYTSYTKQAITKNHNQLIYNLLNTINLLFSPANGLISLSRLPVAG